MSTETVAAPNQDVADSAASALLSIVHLHKEYRAGETVLKDINLEIQGSGVTAIIGPSGTGKSTLIRCINRLVDPSAGEIWFRGQDMAQLQGKALRQARCHIGMVFQEYNLVERLTVIENILCGKLGAMPLWRPLLRKFEIDDIAQAFDLIDAVGLSQEFASRRADALSGGQRQRVGIARALMQQPSLILADEPTSSLDPKTSVEIMELLTQVSVQRRMPVVINIHNVDLAKRFATRIIGMSRGAVVFDGPPESMRDHHLNAIYGGEDWQT